MRETQLRRLGVSLFALLLVVSAAAPVAVQPATASAPAGMVTVPDSQITTDMPTSRQFEELGITVEDLEGSVYAEAGKADTLEVVLTTPGRAEGKMGVDNVLGSGPIAIVFRDDTDSSGRAIAVDRRVLEQALGYTPEMARGTHESGDVYRDAITYENGAGRFEIDHFSSNTITYAGTVSVDMTGATDGSSSSYDAGDADAVSNFTISVTGNTSTETDTFPVGRNASDSSTISGSSIPSSASVDLSWATGSVSETADTLFGGNDAEVYSKTWSDPPMDPDTLTIDWADGGSSGETLDFSVWVDGTEVVNNRTVDISGSFSGSETFNLSTHENVGEVRFEIFAPSGVQASYQGSSISGQTPDSADITVDGTTKTYTTQTTKSFSLDGDSSVAASTSVDGGDAITADISYDETQKTVDPSVTVNSNTASYSGTLNDTETVSLSTDTSWIQDGTNTVTVGTASVVSDAPTPQVDVSYSHDAQDKVSVDYDADEWEEGYNVSHTFASDRTSASLTIPFEGTVLSIQSIEKKVNGGSWTSVSSSNWDLSGTTLTVDFGTVSAGDTVAVRTSGRMVSVTSGSITVVEPTVRGNKLDTKVRLDSWQDGAYIEVGSTTQPAKIHYAYNADYGEGNEYAVLTSSGGQQLYFPLASAGAELRVSTIPVKAVPQSGQVRVSVDAPSSTEPEFDVDPGASSGDTVDYTFVSASSGEDYVLYSTTRDVVVDSGTASSPLTLTDDDSDETLQFQLQSGSSSGGGGGSLVGGPIRSPSPDFPLVLVAYAGVLVALYLVDRGGRVRVPNPIPSAVPVVGSSGVTVPLPGSRGPLFWGGGTLATLVVLEYLGGGLISRTIFRTVGNLTSPLADVVPLAGIVAVLLAAYYLYQRFIVGRQPRDIIIRSGGGGNG